MRSKGISLATALENRSKTSLVFGLSDNASYFRHQRIFLRQPLGLLHIFTGLLPPVYVQSPDVRETPPFHRKWMPIGSIPHLHGLSFAGAQIAAPKRFAVFNPLTVVT